MPTAGTFAAYSEAYRDRPIDAAGNIAKSVDTGITKAIDKAEKDKKEKELRDSQNEKMFGDAAKQIKVQDGAPPSAQYIAGIGGDQIAEIYNSLPAGTERAQKIQQIITKSNRAINAITLANNATKKEVDAYGTDQGWLNNAKNLLSGDLTYMWEDGKLMVQGTGKDGTTINMDLDTFTDTIKVPDAVAKLDSASNVEALQTLKTKKGADLKTAAGQAAIVADANNLATQSLNYNSTNGAIATTRWMYNNEGNLEIPSESKGMLLQIGTFFEDGGNYNDLDKDQKALLEKYLPTAQKAYGAQLINSSFGALQTPKAGSGDGTYELYDTKFENPDSAESSIEILDYASDDTEALDTVMKTIEADGFGETSTTIPSPDGKSNITIDVNPTGWSVGRGLGVGSRDEGEVTIGGQTFQYNNNEEGNSLRDVIEKQVYGQQAYETKRFYSFQETTVDGVTVNDLPNTQIFEGTSNMGTISTRLDVLYNKDGYNFQPNNDNNGVTAIIGSKKISIPLAGLSPAAAAKKVALYVRKAK